MSSPDRLWSPTGRVRTWFLAMFVSVLGAASLPAATQAFAVSKWEAGTCAQSSCTDAGPASAFYTQASGHPDFGITDFRFAATEHEILGKKWEEPVGHVANVRVDLPPGMAVNPEATKELCTEAELNSDKEECPLESKVGEDEATGTAEILAGVKETVTEHFPVYNMVRKPGEPSRFGVEINSATLKLLGLQGHTYLEGGISWKPEEAPADGEGSGVASGDYHEYFKIEGIPQQPEVIESRLVFWGVPQEHTHVGTPTAFLTLPSTSCSVKPVTTLHVDSYEDPGQFLAYENTTPVAPTGCDELAFNPTLSLTAGASQSDQPDGITTDLHVPQPMGEPSKPDSPEVQDAQVTLPEGMTLDASAAHGLEACSDAQYAQDACPSASQVGTVAVNAPGIPDGSLNGGVYVGSPEPGKGPESGGEYRIFVIGEAPQYGAGVRLEGRVTASTQTGQLTATFSGAPPVPFEDFVLRFNGGPRAPLANPLSCGQATPAAAITPYGGEPAAAAHSSGFLVDGNGAGGACPSPLPFSLVQSIAPQSPAQAGAYSPFDFGLARADGQQYLSSVTTTLPPGLVGAIPSVPLCGEPQANAGTCPQGSQIGTVAVAAGAGSEPYVFNGLAYLTGPYGGAPYGLSVVVPAVAGPYDLGDVVTRAGIEVGLYSGRVTVTSQLPTVVGGVPLRLKSLAVDVNRQKFLFNPTSCGPLATESTLKSTFGATQSLSSPFQVGGCSALAFKPVLSASTSGAKVTRPQGASIEVKITQPAGQANIREVQMQLPPQLVARLSTLQKACTAAEFETGPPPGVCKSTAKVGEAIVTTPVLAGQLKGPAYYVSHGAEAFPDLDLVVQGDGVEVVLVGHTHIAHSSITTSTFEDLPDVPVASVTVKLPLGANSAVSSNGRLCRANPTLQAPTTIVAQSGAKITQNTKIAVSHCPIEVLSHKLELRRSRMILTIWAPEAGRLTITGSGVRKTSVRVRKAGEIKLSVRLKASGVAALHKRGRKLKLRVAFAPKSGHNTSALKLALR